MRQSIKRLTVDGGRRHMTKQKGNIEDTLESIKNMLDSIKFGTITLVIQDGHVVQIEKNEKIRLK